MRRKRVKFIAKNGKNGFVSFLARKRKKSGKSVLYKEFEKEKKEHPSLPSKTIWQIVYDHKRKFL